MTGRIVDADTNQPLPGVDYSFGALQTNQNQTYISGTYSPNTPTNSKGEFRLEGVEPGRYAIMASSRDFMFNQTSSQRPKVYSDPLPFEVTDGDVADLEVKAQRGLSISGIIVTDGITDKNALAALSRLVVTGFAESTPNTLQSFPSGTTSPIASDGTFQLDGLRPGKVQIDIAGLTSTEARGLTISRIVHERASGRRIDLAPGQSVSGVRVYLAYGTGVVKGQIKVEGGTLPADALMFVSVQRPTDMARMSSAQVDSRGRFVAQSIPTGTYEVILQIVSFGPTNTLPRGFPRTQKQTVTVTDDSESEVLFTLDLTPKEGP